MRVVRMRRGKKNHLTADLRLSLCNRKLVAPILEPDACPDCIPCLEADAEIRRGN